MHKKNYNSPKIDIIKINPINILKASQIQNIENDVQNNIKKNDGDDFEAGAKWNKLWGIIDWEQRRYEVAKDILANHTIHGAFKKEAIEFAIEVSNKFIKELKKESDHDKL